MVDALNITFDEVEKRDYVRRSLLTYVATVAAIVFLIVVFSVLVAAPIFFHDLGLRRFGVWWGPVRWLVVAGHRRRRLHPALPLRPQPPARPMAMGGFRRRPWRRSPGWAFP